jgi:cytidine deaminase
MSKKISFTHSFNVYNSEKELNDTDKNLLLAAKEALKKAYAPYSQFYVGAAVLLANGVTVTGNNQENAAYPSGLCAERVAIFHASSQYPDQKIIAIAVSAKTNHRVLDKPISPCGACRQSISEYEVKFNSDIRLIMGGETGEVYVSDSAANLLPLTFSNKNL